MKLNHPSLIKQAAMRVFLAALTAALLATLASCDNPNPNEPGFDALSSQINALSKSVADSREQSDKLAFWQIAAAFLIVVSGFALIGGAALGSMARRETRAAQEKPEPNLGHGDHEKLR